MLTSKAITGGHKSGRRGQLQRLLSAANSNVRRRAGLKPSAPAAAGAKRDGTVAPGPFDATAFRQEQSNSPLQALFTGLLVVYPVFASVAVVLAGLWLLGSSRPI
jgi:hypothetical protein